MKLKKAGKLIISCDEINDFYNETLEIVEHWRDAHVEPTNEMLKICKKSISGLSNPVCVSRMKRTETIIDKLNRHKDKHLQLQKFDDIGGCRIIVDNIEDVYKVLGNLSKYDMHKKPSDYIKNPKKWGYRCIHVHHRFNSDGFCYDNLRIETQIRTTFQHAWATAVEVLDVIDNTNYKFGVGDEDVLTFFALFGASVASVVEV